MTPEAALALDVLDSPLVRWGRASETDAAPAPPARPAPAALPIVPRPRKGVVRVQQPGAWPTSTSTLCWHCCHAFDGQPLPLPIKYDDRRDEFHVVGTFCSWACMKAYNLASNSYMRHVNATLLTLFHKRCTGQLRGIRAAPPRLALQAFGGTMSIEEFRGCDKLLDVLPPKMILHRPVVEEIPERLRKRPTPAQLQDSVSFKDTTTQNDMLRLRRPKPLTSHNLLVRTMGVQILQPAAS